MTNYNDQLVMYYTECGGTSGILLLKAPNDHLEQDYDELQLVVFHYNPFNVRLL